MKNMIGVTRYIQILTSVIGNKLKIMKRNKQAKEWGMKDDDKIVIKNTVSSSSYKLIMCIHTDHGITAKTAAAAANKLIKIEN